MQKKSKGKPEQISPLITIRLREGLFICMLAVALFLFLSLITYNSYDSGWSHVGSNHDVKNAGGPFGAWFSDIGFYIFGYFAYMFPVIMGYIGYLLFKQRLVERQIDYLIMALRLFGFFLTIVAGCGLAFLHFKTMGTHLPIGAGGVLGTVFGQVLHQQFSYYGSTLLLGALFLSGLTLATGVSWLKLSRDILKLQVRLAKLFQKVIFLGGQGIFNAWLAYKDWREKVKLEKAARVKPVINTPAAEPKKTLKKAIAPIKQRKKINVSKRAENDRQLSLFKESSTELPSFQLLEPAKINKGTEVSKAVLEEVSHLVEIKLADFGVEVKVVAVHPGPVITRFELQLAPGIKVSKITGLAKDLARSLSVVSVRVVEIIPGKPVVGLELPNETRQVVRLREVLSSEDYEKVHSPLTLALGKDIAGGPVVVDLAKMPHLLVAGTTGSGKSVGVNAMLLSMLYKAQPSEVRMIMIDPKMLELSVYEGIPHLLAPVVTDMKEAANSLKWCVAEMERRYQLMAALSVRNISGYNKKVKDALKNKQPIADPTFEAKEDGEEAPLLEPMPYIVVIVDEFADMMMVVGKKVEELIARIAQKARAAGIHLILATQRPSVDVITGLIKANVPTRIAFQVASRVDSRTILDQQGAEQLLGKGDMLYLPAGAGIPVRVHGAFVADGEVLSVVNDWKKRGSPDYHEEILNGVSSGSAGFDNSLLGEDSEEAGDPLYDKAVMIVTESRRASISLVQRRLKIGYNRAARLVEQMEAEGVVSSMQSNGTREVIAPPPPPSTA